MELDRCNILPTWFPAPSLCCPLYYRCNDTCPRSHSLSVTVLEFEPESKLLKKQKHKKGKGPQIDIYNYIPNVNHHPQSLLLLFSDYYQPQANWPMALAGMPFPVVSLHLCPGCSLLWPVISSALSCRALQPELSSLGRMSQFTTSHDTDLIFSGLTLLLGKNPYFPNHPAPHSIQSLVRRFD